MKIDLKKYLEERRSDLDVESPDDALIWEGIRADIHGPVLPPKKKPGWARIRNIAAAGLIILALGYMLGDLVGEHQEQGLARLNPELGAMEEEYRTILEIKMQEAGQYNPNIHNLVIEELYAEVLKLDTIYQQCLEDMEILGYNEQVIQTILDTYEKKIYLLELIIMETQKMNSYETDNKILL